jgi:hypothetical protein
VLPGERGASGGAAGASAACSRFLNSEFTPFGELARGFHPRRRTVSVMLRRPNDSASLQFHMYKSTSRPFTAGPVSMTV